jgi:acetolactate synthase-1/2/3 large subunit
LPAKSRTGAQVLVDQLLIQRVTDVFCVPGESYLAVLDALHDSELPPGKEGSVGTGATSDKVRVTICRQEAGAGFMADAVGRLTGRPGVYFTTRGPGATNGAHPIHVAMQDSIPLIMFVGQIDRSMREREAFQEVDYRAAFGPLAKWATEIDDAARIPEVVSRAFHVAMNGRPGPVVIALPEDMLTDVVEVADAPYVEAMEVHPGAAQMEALQARLMAARAPMAIIGGTRWTPEATKNFADFAEKHRLPVATTFRRQMLFAPDHPSFVGDLGLGPNPKLIEMIKSSDLLLIINTRLSEAASQGYTLLDIPGDGKRIVHVHADAGELGRVYATAMPVNATPAAFAAALADLPAPNAVAWEERTKAGHAAYHGWTDTPAPVPGPLHMGEVMKHLRETLPADAVITNGAGNYATWIHRFYRFRQFGTQAAPTCGSMGYGLPAAVGVKRRFPERLVVSVNGDGCFLMNGQEFATAVQYDLPIIALVVDNGMYGTIRMHQEREYPGRPSGTWLKNPDFAAYARAFGGHGETVRSTEEFAPAFARAVASGKPAILHLFQNPEAITPATTLTAIREKAKAEGK